MLGRQGEQHLADPGAEFDEPLGLHQVRHAEPAPRPGRRVGLALVLAARLGVVQAGQQGGLAFYFGGPGFWTSCPTCGETRRHAGRCARYTLDRRLHELLGDAGGQIRPHLAALYQALASAERPGTVTVWLDRSAAPAILQELETEIELTHAALGALPPGKPVEHLRSVLVAVGTLPHRGEQMARLERWITATIADRVDPDQQNLLHRYAVWHLLRRLRRRTQGADTTHEQPATVRQHVRAAIGFLDWLTVHDLTLATCRQNHLATWITSDQTTHRRETGHFVRWAKKHKLTRLDFPATRWGGPSRVLDTEVRWDQARHLLHDDTLAPEERVAGLLVLLYAQWPSTISRLSFDHVHIDDEHVRLSLGREPVILPEPSTTLSGTYWPGAAAPPSATRPPRPGCFPAGNPDARSAPSGLPNACATSVSTPARPAPPPCSTSPPTCPPPSWPACSASASR